MIAGPRRAARSIGLVLSALAPLAACESEVLRPGTGGAGGTASSSGPIASSAGPTTSSTGQGAGGEAEGPPCTQLAPVDGGVVVIGRGGFYRLGMSRSRDGADVVIHRAYDLEWLDPWSTWPPQALGEREHTLYGHLVPGFAEGVTAFSIDGETSELRSDITPASDGTSTVIDGNSLGALARVGREVWLVTGYNFASAIRLQAFTASNTSSWSRELLHCAGSNEGVATPAIASTGPSGATLLALSDAAMPGVCDGTSRFGRLLVYALDADGNGDATLIEDGSTEHITSLALVPHDDGATLVYGRITEASPAVNAQAVLWMVSLDGQGLAIAPPKILELEGISSTRNAVVRMAGGGFAVARWVAYTTPLPEEWDFAISLFDRDGNFLQEIPIADTSPMAGNLFGGARAVASPDGRSAFFAWPEDVGEPLTESKVLRLDCVE